MRVLFNRENSIRYIHPNAPTVYGVQSRKQISAKKNISKDDYQRQICKDGNWINA
tara:strand:+ start:265 stop:429 length:165 start_codon:yes stop_codon:yes gene_type:complete